VDRKKQSGQALVEYILLLSIVVGVVGFFVSKLTTSLDTTTGKYGAIVERQLRTGKAPASIWTK
jgi:hypothetical protein